MKKILYTYLSVIFILHFNNRAFSQAGAATCATATSLTVNGTCGAGSIAAGVGVSAGSNATICGATVKRDRWYRFTTLNTTATTTITATSASPGSVNRDLALEVLTSCSAASIACVNTVGTPAVESITLNLAANTTYYLRIANVATSVTPLSMGYSSVCITQPPVNDEPVGATSLTVGNGVCNFTSLSNATAKSSACAPLPSCGSYVPTGSGGTSVDVWCMLEVPASGNFFLQTESFGFLDNAGIAVYSSSVCGSAPIACSDGNPDGVGGTIEPMSMPTLYVTGATPTSTVYIRIWNKNGFSKGGFNICANDMGPCGNDATTNDFCATPTPISSSGFSGANVANNNTGLTFTNDIPGDVSVVACMYPDLNSWYTFIATTADQTSGLSLPFSVGGSPCTGLDAQIFSVTKNGYGCCKNFTQLSSCSSGSVASANSTFTLTVPPGSLASGTTYYLMVNNHEASCSYSITGFQTTGILPVEFVSFTGNNEGRHNLLEWIIASEKNMVSYTLQHSADATNFENVVTLNAKNDQGNTRYIASDEKPFENVTYYRVKQLDLSGVEKFTNIVSVSLKSMYDNIYNIHPNPTNNNLNFEFYSKSNSAINIELLNYAGASVLKLNKLLEEGKNNITLPMSGLDIGVYILKVVSERSGKTTHHKIIKN